MNRTVFLFIVLVLSLSADERVKSPASVHTEEGKSVYAPIKPPVNLYEEFSIQQADHNVTGHGAAR